MKLYVIGFTKKGTTLAKKICEKMDDANCFSMKCQEEGITMVSSLKNWTEKAFQKADGIVFVGACGIAVRAIAPFLKEKFCDPAVVVVDEKGSFVISLLSGHVGKANMLTNKIAQKINGTAVITTATDINNIFAVDVWIKQKGFLYLKKEEAKKTMKWISATLLDKKIVGFDTIFEYDALPKGIQAKKEGEIGISLSIYHEKKKFEKTLFLIAPIVHIGIGCKKNISSQAVEEAVFGILKKENIPIEAVEALSTIDLKKNEKGILYFCEKYQKPLHTFSAEELSKAEGNFTASDFVKQTTGVDNVCERAAICSCDYGKLLLPKKVYNGVTIALAMKKMTISF